METGDRIAMVTGAGSGIGRAIALALLDEGYPVVMAGRRREALEHTAALARAGAESLVVLADISDPTSVSAIFDATRAAFGRLDLLFNNAGTGAPAVSLEDLPFDQWLRVVEVNLTGTLWPACHWTRTSSSSPSWPPRCRYRPISLIH